MPLQTFDEFERQIPPQIIYCVHKSFIIPIAHIGSIEKSGIKIKNLVVPLSESCRERFFALIKTLKQI